MESCPALTVHGGQASCALLHARIIPDRCLPCTFTSIGLPSRVNSSECWQQSSSRAGRHEGRRLRCVVAGSGDNLNAAGSHGAESMAQRLRQLLAGPSLVQGPCCYDALSARLVEMAGFPLTVMSGFSVSASRLGLPDAGLLSYGEMVDQAGLIVSAIGIPLIADADTGYGNAVNVKRTVNGYRQSGVGAIILEDQVWPKACGHTSGRKVVGRDEAVMRIRAAVDARNEGPGDILVVGRSDACQALSREEAIWRAQAFADAGADMVFVDALASTDDMKALCRALPHVPKMVNILEGGKTPVLSPLELEDLGFKLALYPLSLLGVSIKAMQEALRALKSGRLPPSSILPTFEEVKTVVGFPQYYAEEQRYASSSSIAPSASPPALEPVDNQVAEEEEEADGEVCMGDFECDDEQTPEVKAWAAAASSGSGRVPGAAAFTSPESAALREEGFGNGAHTQGDTLGSKAETAVVQRGGAQTREGTRGRTEVVEADEILQDGGGSYSSGRTRSGSFGTAEGLWSRVLRVRITDRMDNVKLDVRVPAGFLDGLASTIPAVAGLDFKALLGDKIRENATAETSPLLDFTTRDGSGDRVQIFLE